MKNRYGQESGNVIYWQKVLISSDRWHIREAAMLKIYSEKKAKKMIRERDTLIRNISASYHLPPACLKAILMMEIPQVDLADLAADATVRINWLRYSLGGRFDPDRHTRNPLKKFDSSTGFGQIFSQVAIDAILFARSLDIPLYTGTGDDLFPFRPDDLKQVWTRLNRDEVFNLSCAALNLLHAAFEMTGKIDLSNASENELKLVFSRYNGNVKKISTYGERAYSYYLDYQHEEEARSAKIDRTQEQV